MTVAELAAAAWASWAPVEQRAWQNLGREKRASWAVPVPWEPEIAYNTSRKHVAAHSKNRKHRMPKN